jgi:hypothetical protein
VRLGAMSDPFVRARSSKDPDFRAP